MLCARVRCRLEITEELIAAAEQLAGLRFTASERELMRDDLGKQLERYAQLRSVALANDVAPALVFDPQPTPILAEHPPDGDREASGGILAAPAPQLALAEIEDLAFLPITRLAELVRTRQVSSVALTEMYLRRLKRYDPALRCV